MDYLDKILSKYSSYSPVEQRIALFEYVRDIPYKVSGKQDPYLLFRDNQGDCAAKAKLLSLLLRKLGYKTRRILAKYKLRDFPSEVKYIPQRTDYHHALQVKIKNKWITVDATYDSPLAKHGFKVNSWDGIHSTPLAEKPMAIKIKGRRNVKFDKRFALFIKELKRAYKEHPVELKRYTEKYNATIATMRKTSHENRRMG